MKYQRWRYTSVYKEAHYQWPSGVQALVSSSAYVRHQIPHTSYLGTTCTVAVKGAENIPSISEFRKPRYEWNVGVDSYFIWFL